MKLVILNQKQREQLATIFSNIGLLLAGVTITPFFSTNVDKLNIFLLFLGGVSSTISFTTSIFLLKNI